MSLQPIFPQFAAACAEFAGMKGYPRPFAALDWCTRCGQPDWAHQAGGADRMCRLGSMNPDDMSYALAYLAEYSPATLTRQVRYVALGISERAAVDALLLVADRIGLAAWRCGLSKLR